jgi:adenine-specific DNA-methyltransferase
MEKLNPETPDLAQAQIERLRELFPECVTEAENGLAVDFDALKQALSSQIVEGPRERYMLDWPGKRRATAIGNQPTDKTLRPVRDESVDFDTTQNLFIEGDNLEALKLIQETYLGQVKMIYIDPPYNTGKDFVYRDDFKQAREDYEVESDQRDEEGNRLVTNPETSGRFHSNWLSMMYPRLKLAKNLLADDGVITVHIDENELTNLDKVLGEVFGDANCVGTIVWDKRNPKGDAHGVAQQHEYISIFTKNWDAFKNNIEFQRPKENADRMLKKASALIAAAGGEVTSEVREEYRQWVLAQDLSGGERAYSKIDGNGDVYQEVSMSWPNIKEAPDDYRVPLIHPKTGKACPVPERGWRNPTKTMKQLLDKKRIVFGPDESTQPRRKYLLKENVFENVSSLLYFGGGDELKSNPFIRYFENPKPLAIVKKLLESVQSDNLFVLDFFAGSATTAHAVMQLNAEDGGNRRFIMVQLPEACDEKSEAAKAGYANIAEISKERIRRAGQKIREGDCHKDWNKDVGFRVLKVDESNLNAVRQTPDATSQGSLLDAVENIKPDRSEEDLLFDVMRIWGIDLAAPIERQKIDGKTVFLINEDDLVACFDESITEDFVKQLTGLKPLKIVFRDDAFASDDVKINTVQIFKQASSDTEVRSI